MLTLTGVRKRFGGARPRVVLDDVSLALAPGEFVAVLGESGVGKSTLLNLVAGLDRPDAGRIEFEGRDLGALDDRQLTLLRRKYIGFVFQAFHVLPYLDLSGNVGLPLDLLGILPEERNARVQAVLAAVGLGDRLDSRPRELSGGELQRVAIARALVHRPRLLLADEPTGNLDPDTAEDVLALFRRSLAESGAACILVTHSRAAAGEAHRVLRLTRSGLVPA